MRLYIKLASLAVVLAIAGCNSLPILNVDQVAIPSQTLSQEQVRLAIIRGGDTLGWKMKDEGPNKMVGTLILRKHVAVVEIPYTATSYSIKYRSSIEMDEKDGNIHKAYNGWIKNLSRNIAMQLAAS